MPAIRISTLALTGLVLLLPGCASTPPPEEEPKIPAAPMDPNDLPELTLNLPEQTDVDCVRPDPVDYTFLDKGFSALVEGDHIEAVQYFQRYQRLEPTAEAAWEAGIAIAYDSMLPRSPFYDPAAAARSYERLQRQQVEGRRVHEKTLMMRDALETFAAMVHQIQDLETDNAMLSVNLAKREEALKRLRELTLGQKGVAQ